MTRETTLEKRWRKSGKSFATNGSISIATGSRSYWKVTPAPDNVWQSWFALDPIPSAASINVEWPWGLGCDSVQGTVLRNGNNVDRPVKCVPYAREDGSALHHLGDGHSGSGNCAWDRSHRYGSAATGGDPLRVGDFRALCLRRAPLRAGARGHRPVCRVRPAVRAACPRRSR